MRVNIRKDERISSQRYGRDALPRDSGVARLEARFRLLPWPLARVQRIWRLFAFMDVRRRIARERVPTSRNDVTIMRETVHSGFFAEMQSIRPRSGSNHKTYSI